MRGDEPVPSRDDKLRFWLMPYGGAAFGQTDADTRARRKHEERAMSMDAPQSL